MKNKGIINKSLLLLAVTSITHTAHAGIDVNLNKDCTSDEVYESALKNLNKYDLSLEIVKSFSLLNDNLVVDGEKLNLELASTDDSTGVIPPPSTGACYANCYTNCYTNCHGARGWR